MSTDKSKEELKIKDLLIKLQVLKNALVEEKKKTQTFTEQIKEYEETIQKKENEIVELNRQKFELKSKLTIEKRKLSTSSKNDSILGNIFHKINSKPIEESKHKKYDEVIDQQSFEIKDLSQRLMEEKESSDQEKMKFQTEIAVKDIKIEELNDKIEILTKENTELNDSKNNINSMIQNFESQKKSYEEKIQQLEKEKLENEYKANDIQKRLDLSQKINDEKEKENEELKKQINDLVLKINNMKNEMLSRQLTPKTFKVEKVNKHGIITTNKKLMTITFQVNNDKNMCEVIFKRNKQKGPVEDRVNIIDITKFQINDKNPNKVDISFMLNELEYNYSVIVHEMIIDLLFQTYQEFLTKANGGF